MGREAGRKTCSTCIGGATTIASAVFVTIELGDPYSGTFKLCARPVQHTSMRSIPPTEGLEARLIACDGQFDVMNTLLGAYFVLTLAIVTEVAGTTSLQLSDQLTRPVPAIVMGICYLTSLWFLSLALRSIPIGIAYAIWSGLGIVLISVIGYVKFRQALDIPAMVGVGLIIAGVVVANLFSHSTAH